MAERNLQKLHRNFLLITQQASHDGKAAELLTGLPRSVIDRIALLDIDEIDELVETMSVSLITLRLSDQAFSRLIQMTREAKNAYAQTALVGNGSADAPFP